MADKDAQPPAGSETGKDTGLDGTGPALAQQQQGRGQREDEKPGDQVGAAPGDGSSSSSSSSSSASSASSPSASSPSSSSSSSASSSTSSSASSSASTQSGGDPNTVVPEQVGGDRIAPAQNPDDEDTPDKQKQDLAEPATELVVVGGKTPNHLEPWSKDSAGDRCVHPNEEKQAQHEACLCEAAYSDDVELAQRMLREKVDVNCVRFKGRTPLHYCALGNGTQVAQLLATCKADLTWPDEDGKTPEQLGRECGNTVTFLVSDAVREDAVSR